MKKQWEKYSALFNARVIRERIIIALCVLAGVYFIWDFAVLQGLSAKRQALDARYKTASAEIQKLNAEETVLSQALRNNPNAKKQREIVQLNDRLVALDQKIEKLSVGLVSAEKLPDVLRDVLSSRNDLTLLGLHALEPEKLSLVSAEESEGEVDDSNDRVGVFKHRVILRLKGRYFSVRDYLTDLEKSDWNFYWSSLEYAVDGYPDAVVQLEVYTLSTDRGFMGE